MRLLEPTEDVLDLRAAAGEVAVGAPEDAECGLSQADRTPIADRTPQLEASVQLSACGRHVAGCAVSPPEMRHRSRLALAVGDRCESGTCLLEQTACFVELPGQAAQRRHAAQHISVCLPRVDEASGQHGLLEEDSGHGRRHAFHREAQTQREEER